LFVETPTHMHKARLHILTPQAHTSDMFTHPLGEGGGKERDKV